MLATETYDEKAVGFIGPPGNHWQVGETLGQIATVGLLNMCRSQTGPMPIRTAPALGSRGPLWRLRRPIAATPAERLNTRPRAGF